MSTFKAAEVPTGTQETHHAVSMHSWHVRQVPGTDVFRDKRVLESESEPLPRAPAPAKNSVSGDGSNKKAGVPRQPSEGGGTNVAL